jgi:hypothetical protein
MAERSLRLVAAEISSWASSSAKTQPADRSRSTTDRADDGVELAINAFH